MPRARRPGSQRRNPRRSQARASRADARSRTGTPAPPRRRKSRDRSASARSPARRPASGSTPGRSGCRTCHSSSCRSRSPSSARPRSGDSTPPSCACRSTRDGLEVIPLYDEVPVVIVSVDSALTVADELDARRPRGRSGDRAGGRRARHLERPRRRRAGFRAARRHGRGDRDGRRGRGRRHRADVARAPAPPQGRRRTVRSGTAPCPRSPSPGRPTAPPPPSRPSSGSCADAPRTPPAVDRRGTHGGGSPTWVSATSPVEPARRPRVPTCDPHSGLLLCTRRSPGPALHEPSR